MDSSKYYTLRGYSLNEKAGISAAMEDYLEMIYRLILGGEFVRVNQLASLLNVTPSASSKMVNKLKDAGMVIFEPYGIIQLTEQGKELGGYLYRRHNILHAFFRKVNKSDCELELVEKIEHYFDQRTIANIEILLNTHLKDVGGPGK